MSVGGGVWRGWLFALAVVGMTAVADAQASDRCDGREGLIRGTLDRIAAGAARSDLFPSFAYPPLLHHASNRTPIMSSSVRSLNGPGEIVRRSSDSGAREEESPSAPFGAAMDLEYIATWSLSQDIRILLRTVTVVLTGQGAY